MPRPARSRQTPSKTSLRREALLERLVGVIQTQGFASANLDSLARELKCSKSTLYTIADTKERIVLAAIRKFFARATADVEQRLALSNADPIERIRVYLIAIAEALSPASPDFFADLDESEAAQAIYRDNTRAAAARVKQMVAEAAPRATDAAFIGAVTSQVMEGIHRGDIEQSAGLDDASAYRALADLIVRGLHAG